MRRRMIVWYATLDAYDQAFEVMQASLVEFSETGTSLQFEQVEVLFIHAGSVIVESDAVREGSPLLPMSLHCRGYRGRTSDRHADRA